jgi:hypothetical protein
VRCGLTVLDGPFAVFKALLREVTATEHLTFGAAILLSDSTGILDWLAALKPSSGLLVVVSEVGEHLPIGFPSAAVTGSAALTRFLGERWNLDCLSIGSVDLLIGSIGRLVDWAALTRFPGESPTFSSV